MSTCRGCGQPIRWIPMASGKQMPVDAEPRLCVLDPQRPFRGYRSGSWCRAHGTLVRRGAERKFFDRLQKLGFHLAWVHLSHFATCPAAARFRTRSEAKDQACNQ